MRRIDLGGVEHCFDAMGRGAPGEVFLVRFSERVGTIELECAQMGRRCSHTLREKAAYFAALSHVYLSRNEEECQATLSENKWEIIFTGVIETLTFVRRFE